MFGHDVLSLHMINMIVHCALVDCSVGSRPQRYRTSYVLDALKKCTALQAVLTSSTRSCVSFGHDVLTQHMVNMIVHCA